MHLVSGAQDLRVEVEGASMKEVADFVAQKLSGVERVTATSTHFLLRRYKDDGQLLIDPEPDQRLSVTPMAPPAKPFSRIVGEVPPSIRRFFDIVSQMEDVISLGVGEPDFVTPWRIREAAIHCLEHGYTTYTSNCGLPELREAVAGYLDRALRRANTAPTARCLITVGRQRGARPGAAGHAEPRATR